jgi:protein phosphatase
VLIGTLVVLALIGGGAFLALQSVYFIGTNERGLVTLYQGVPFSLPGNIELYSSQYVSGVGASTVSAQRRSTLLDHTLRSEAKAASLIRSLELDQLE